MPTHDTDSVAASQSSHGFPVNHQRLSVVVSGAEMWARSHVNSISIFNHNSPNSALCCAVFQEATIRTDLIAKFDSFAVPWGLVRRKAQE